MKINYKVFNIILKNSISKKIGLPVLFFLFLSIKPVTAQYTVLHNFDVTGGSYPEGSLILSGNVLYGMTTGVSGSSYGNVFSIHTDGSSYKDLFDFNNTNGGIPSGTLTLLRNKLYGVTQSGGTNSYGCIFSIDTNGSGFKDIFSFNYTDGAYPLGSLTLSGSKFYGMASVGGGGSGYGCIFSIDTNGTGYKEIFNFSNTNGRNPQGDLTLSLSGTKFYGMAPRGGASNYGCVFSVDTSGGGFKDIYDFNTSGKNPFGNLTLSGYKLYGMTQLGGASDSGCVFSIDTNGSGYKDIHDFNGSAGDHPQGSLLLVSNVLYGLTFGGGTNLAGCIFSMDTNATAYMDMYDLSGGLGQHPYASLIVSGKTYYGTTEQGGTKGYGVIFSYTPGYVGISELENGIASTLYPNPNHGRFTIEMSVTEDKSTIEIYNMVGQEVYTNELQQTIRNYQIDISGQPAGLYIYRVISEKGECIANAKFVMQ